MTPLKVPKGPAMLTKRLLAVAAIVAVLAGAGYWGWRHFQRPEPHVEQKSPPKNEPAPPPPPAPTPEIVVSASFAGIDSKTIADDYAVLFEQAVMDLPKVVSMRSQCGFGRYTLTITL